MAQGNLPDGNVKDALSSVVKVVEEKMN